KDGAEIHLCRRKFARASRKITSNEKILRTKGEEAVCPQKSLTVHRWFKSCKSLKNCPNSN
ncbi:MAG: hypothetical protein KDE32_04640, partial [Novosphingobium sp.]|nr:hypothetical protein [Novosphingobium sp.]